MNGAIIGFGNIAQAHIHAYEAVSDMSITGIIDSSETRINYAKQIHPQIKSYTSIEKLFVEQSIDFIDICTPPDTHFYYIKKGLLANCHVLCEKPFLTDPENYSEVFSLMCSSGKHVYPLHNYKYAPIVKWMKEHVKSNEFGEIKQGYFRTIRNGHAHGTNEWNKDWRRIPKISAGGILLDHGPHNIYLTSFLMEKNPIAVSCITGNLAKETSYSNTEDTAILSLYFENEVTFFLELTWAGCFRKTHYSLVGSKQSLFVDNNNICISKNGVFETIEMNSDFDDPMHKNWFCEMFYDFLNLIENPERQDSLFQEAFTTTTVIQRAYESATKNGEILPIKSIFEQKIEDSINS